MGETVLSCKKFGAQNRFDAAVAHFQNQQFKQARELFATIANEVSEDRAAAMYVERCGAFLANPPPLDWDGALHLRRARLSGVT